MLEYSAKCAQNGRQKNNAKSHNEIHRTCAPCCVCRGYCTVSLPMTTTRAHCNECGGDRNHAILHAEKTSWVSDDEHAVSGGDKYETLKCLGCDAIKLRHTSWCSEDDGSTVYYFPPSVFRKRPELSRTLWLELPTEEEFVDGLLEEIYSALQNNDDGSPQWAFVPCSNRS